MAASKTNKAAPTKKEIDEAVAAKLAAAGVQAPPQPTAIPKSEGDQIWEKIKGLPLDIFALPNQIVEMHCKRIQLDPNCLHLKIKAGAVLPALEETLKSVPLPQDKQWKLENGIRFVVVSIETII